jgi:hypothetical protein
MTPIFIPSKGRADTARLLLMPLPRERINIVVEPQDYAIYNAHHHIFKIHTLPENSKGITYVRNWIKTYTENNNIHKYWQLDDDITGFYKREGTKMLRSDISVLDEAEKQFEPLALAALEYQQIAWSATREVQTNGYCDVCVWVNNTRTFGMRYDAHVEGKEDRDFALQVIAQGERTGRSTLYAFSAPKNGSNEGGLKDIFYDVEGREAECTRRMIEKWPGVCTANVKPDGRPDCKINWRAVGKPSVKSLFGEI